VENDLLELLNEAVFIMAPEMSDIIDELNNSGEDYSKIAKCFYMLDMEDIDTQISYLNLGDDNSTITFLKPEKVDKIRSEKDWTISDVFRETKGNAIRVGRLTRKVIELYNKSKSLRSQSSDVKFTDQEIEKFVNAYKAQYDFKNNIMDNFTLVSSEDDVKEAYSEDNYYNEDGTLGGSCMRYDDAQNYLELYHNTSVNLLVLKSPNKKIMGRAVIWTLTDGRKFMDRTYTNRDSDVDLFVKYAEEHKYIYKVNQNSHANTIFYQPDDNYREEVKIKLESKVYKFSYNGREDEYFPYMDTMKYLYWEEGVIRNYTDESEYYVILEDVDGWCDCNDCGQDGKSECVTCEGSGETVCEPCDGNGWTNCEECGGSGNPDCEPCKGSGMVEDGPSSKEVDCEDCDGNGYKDCDVCSVTGHIDCDECNREGAISCKHCEGEGFIKCKRCGGYSNKWGY
jgi:hypothetical protein